MAYKPKRMMTNHEALPEALSRKCQWGHWHAHLVGKARALKLPSAQETCANMSSSQLL